MSTARTAYRVISSFLHGQLGGVDVFAGHLTRGLVARGIRAEILLTEPEESTENALPFPGDLPLATLPVRRGALWQTRWQAFIRYLQERAPCIYIPSYDYAYSCISPKLSDDVRIVGVVHGDDPDAYEQMTRLGPYWNAIVAVSPAIAAHAAQLAPELAARLTTIMNGVPVPAAVPRRNFDAARPLQVVYAGRLAQRQKRVYDLAHIAALAHARNLPIQLTIIGAGPDEAELQRLCAPLVAHGSVRFTGILPNAAVLETLARADVSLLTSEFEGFPMSVLEAMAQGCIPLVTKIRSGIPELMADGVNGYVVPVGDVSQFVERLALLTSNPALCQRLAENAYRTIAMGKYRAQDMVDHYIELFETVLQQRANRAYRRPRGSILPPADLKWQARLPIPLWFAGYHGKRVLRRVINRS